MEGLSLLVGCRCQIEEDVSCEKSGPWRAGGDGLGVPGERGARRQLLLWAWTRAWQLSVLQELVCKEGFSYKYRT